jgi:hypothetical protein
MARLFRFAKYDAQFAAVSVENWIERYFKNVAGITRQF